MENVNDVAASIIDELGEIDAMSLEKLLYYAQAWSLAITNTPLFADEIQAWRNGPVVPAVYAQHKQQDRVCEWRSGDAHNVAPTTAKLIGMIGAHYGHMKGYQLSKLTHDEAPWKDARGDLPEDAPSRELIPKRAMTQFYREHGALMGWGALEIALAGVLADDDEARNSMVPRSPADTPVCGKGQLGLSPEQVLSVRSRRRSRTSV